MVLLFYLFYFFVLLFHFLHLAYSRMCGLQTVSQYFRYCRSSLHVTVSVITYSVLKDIELFCQLITLMVLISDISLSLCCICPENNHTSDSSSNSDIKRYNSRLFTISSLYCELCPACVLKWSWCSCVQITCNTSHTSCVRCVLCHMVQRDNSAIKFCKVEITFYFIVVYFEITLC